MPIQTIHNRIYLYKNIWELNVRKTDLAITGYKISSTAVWIIYLILLLVVGVRGLVLFILKSKDHKGFFVACSLHSPQWCPTVCSGKVLNTVCGISWVSGLLSGSLSSERWKGEDRGDLAPLSAYASIENASESKWSTSNELRFWFFESAQQLHQVLQLDSCCNCYWDEMRNMGFWSWVLTLFYWPNVYSVVEATDFMKFTLVYLLVLHPFPTCCWFASRHSRWGW